jgi:DNA polymerase I
MKRLIIIDGNAIVHRAYHALPKLTTKKGEVVNAVYGFLLFLVKSINDFKPDYIVATFDYPAPTFRKERYKEYKAHREKAPDELYLQIPKVKNLLEKFGIKVLEKKGFEADDIIGTVSEKVFKEKDVETVILTGDMDALQLVNDKTKVYALRRGIKDAVLFGEDEVREKYDGLLPKQLVEYKALRGDPSDNIPGVFGVGEKTAIELIKKFDSVDNLYKELDKGLKNKTIKDSLKEKLMKHRETAFLSKMLA